MDMTEIAYSLVLEFLRRAMGCFSCCFGTRDDNLTEINRFSKPITVIHKEPVDPLASDCVWSLLPNEDEDADLSQCEDGRYSVTGSPVLDDELRAEAKFLKACGTLPQTPVEFQKTRKSKDLQPENGDTGSTSNSILSNTTIEFEEPLQKQPDQFQSVTDLFQKWENGSDSSSHSSNSTSSNSVKSCMNEPAASTHSVHFKNQTDSSSSSSSTKSSSPEITKIPLKRYESPYDLTTSKPTPESCMILPSASTHCKTKSVHFKHLTDSSPSSSKSSSPVITKIPFKLYESTPYPTPLKLTDDMQTPGTVFPSYGKNPRIRVQYVYSETNPRNFSHIDTPIVEECIEQCDTESPQSQVKLQESTTKKELDVCLTLSSWLPPNSNQEFFVDQSFGQTPGDRPIPGVVTFDCNADETSFTPKWGDVNGIPNTTNKYSEDQKVSWHATPFEERLEKALSEDKFIPKIWKQQGETRCVEF